jgi:sulfide:quinone oxidoreductase
VLIDRRESFVIRLGKLWVRVGEATLDEAERVAGLAEHGFTVYDAASVERAAKVVARLDRGHVVMAIAGVPYKCPPAPYEAMMLLDAHFRSRGIRGETTLQLTTMQPALLPNA